MVPAGEAGVHGKGDSGVGEGYRTPNILPDMSLIPFKQESLNLALS